MVFCYFFQLVDPAHEVQLLTDGRNFSIFHFQLCYHYLFHCMASLWHPRLQAVSAPTFDNKQCPRNHGDVFLGVQVKEFMHYEA